MKWQRSPEYCCKCGKNLVCEETGNKVTGFVFAAQTGALEVENEYLKKQVGEYKTDKYYEVCLECTLKTFGVKP